MKDHFDFSVAERGKFYRADAEFHFPVYLEPDVNEFMTKLAEQKKVAVDDLVNELLRADMNIIQSAGGRIIWQIFSGETCELQQKMGRR